MSETGTTNRFADDGANRPKEQGLSKEELACKIFKFLWPNKCWHKNTSESYNKKLQLKESICSGTCFKCKECVGLYDVNPDLTTPDGMVMILDRLVEMGYDLLELKRDEEGWWLEGFKSDNLDDNFGGDQCSTAPLAVISTMESLIRKEEEGK